MDPILEIENKAQIQTKKSDESLFGVWQFYWGNEIFTGIQCVVVLVRQLLNAYEGTRFTPLGTVTWHALWVKLLHPTPPCCLHQYM